MTLGENIKKLITTVFLSKYNLNLGKGMQNFKVKKHIKTDKWKLAMGDPYIKMCCLDPKNNAIFLYPESYGAFCVSNYRTYNWKEAHIVGFYYCLLTNSLISFTDLLKIVIAIY